MAKIRKIGNEYFVEYYAQGLKFAKRGGTDPAFAEKLKQDIEASYPERIEDIYTVKDDSLDDFLKAFCQFAKNELPSATFAHYMAVLNHFEDFLKHHVSSERKIREITPRLINDYKQYLLQLQKLSPSTVKSQMINFTFYILRDILEYAITLKSLNDNPCNHIELLPVSTKPKPKILDEGTKRRILSDSHPEDAQIIRLILASGLRLNEIKNLRWDDVDLVVNEIQISQDTEEGEISRVIPLDYSLKELFKKCFEDRRGDNVFSYFEPNQFLAALKKLSVSFPVLRNTFIVDLLRKRVPLRKILFYTGYTDIARLIYFEAYFSPIQSIL